MSLNWSVEKIAIGLDAYNAKYPSVSKPLHELPEIKLLEDATGEILYTYTMRRQGKSVPSSSITIPKGTVGRLKSVLSLEEAASANEPFKDEPETIQLFVDKARIVEAQQNPHEGLFIAEFELGKGKQTVTVIAQLSYNMIKSATESWNPITYHLVWTCMSLGLGGITEANVDEFIFRYYVAVTADGTENVYHDNGDLAVLNVVTVEHIRDHVGLKVNVADEDRQEWFVRRVFKGLAENALQEIRKQEPSFKGNEYSFAQLSAPMSQSVLKALWYFLQEDSLRQSKDNLLYEAKPLAESVGQHMLNRGWDIPSQARVGEKVVSIYPIGENEIFDADSDIFELLEEDEDWCVPKGTTGTVVARSQNFGEITVAFDMEGIKGCEMVIDDTTVKKAQ